MPPNIGILALSFQTLEFLPNPFKHLNSVRIFSKHWNCDFMFPVIGLLTLSFQTLEFWSYPYKHWNSDVIFSNIGVLTLSFFNMGIET